MKEKLIPIISIVIGLIAFSLTFRYIQKKDDEYRKMKEKLFASASKVEILVAKTDIISGTKISKKDLAKKTVFSRDKDPRAVSISNVELIIGKRVGFTITANSQIRWSDIEGGEAGASGLSTLIEKRLRAISLSVGGAAAVSGMVQPNDRVDIIGTFSFPSKTKEGEMETATLTILQDVTVLATGTRTAKTRSPKDRRASGYNTVTVAVTPREAEWLVFAQHARGSLTLSLRNASDVHYEHDLQKVNFEQIESKLEEHNIFRQKFIRLKKISNR